MVNNYRSVMTAKINFASTIEPINNKFTYLQIIKLNPNKLFYQTTMKNDEQVRLDVRNSTEVNLG